MAKETNKKKKKPEPASTGGTGFAYTRGGKSFILPQREKEALARKNETKAFQEEQERKMKKREIESGADIEQEARRRIDIKEAEGRIKRERFDALKPDEEVKEADVKSNKGQLNRQKEIAEIDFKLNQTETGKVLDTINRWRLEVKRDNLQSTMESIAKGEMQSYGTVPIGITPIPIVKLAIGQFTAPVQGGLIGSKVVNAKTIALTGNWLRKAGFTMKAAASLGGLIGLTAWGKHVKSEAIEFLPFQISKSREAGFEETARELEELHAEIADPKGWANIIEEIPGLGVIKAAIDKTRVGTKIIEAQKERAGKK